MVFYTKQCFILSLLFLTFFVSQLKAQKLGAETNSNSSYVITSGGSLYTFGNNSNGQLGIGSTTNQNTPQIVSFPSGVTSWTAIAGGYHHSLAIGNDGNLYSWGNNVDGELGIGSTTDQSTPQKVTFPSGVTSWTAIAAGYVHSLAIGNDGNLYSWGGNYAGQLGIGNIQYKSTPQKVTFPSGVTSWTAIAAGYQHSLAIGNNGNLYSWGFNTNGQLGIGSSTQQNTPQKVTFPSGVTSWTAIAAGFYHSLAIGNDGNLYSWGWNYDGELGIGSTTNQNTPQKVTFPSGVTSWTAIAGGYQYSLAIGNDGNLYSWGGNYDGQLGIGSTTNQNTPQKVTFPSGVTSWTAIAGGGYHSLAIGNNGNLYSWGWNASGQLGIGNTTNQYSPKVVLQGQSPIPTLSTTFNSISFGTVERNTSAIKITKVVNTSVNKLVIDSIYTLTPQYIVNVARDTVAIGDSVSISVTFTPNNFGYFKDTLYLHNNSANNLVKIPLSGNSPFQVAFNTATINFGNIAVGQLSTQTISVSNIFNGTATIDTIYTSTPEFIVTPSKAVLNSLDTLQLNIQFKPDMFQTFEDSVVLLNRSLNSAIIIKLFGNSPYPFIVTDKAVLAFDSVNVSNSLIKNITLKDSSLNVLKIDSIYTSTNAFIVNLSNGSKTLGGGESTNLNVEFKPSQSGIFSDTIYIKNNSKYSPYKISVNGIGVAITGIENNMNLLPKSYVVYQNYPNPFNPTTQIKYEIPKDSFVQIYIYNILGQIVSTLVNNVKSAGYYNENWNASKMPSGVYIYTISSRPLDGSKEFRDIKKMILLK